MALLLILSLCQVAAETGVITIENGDLFLQGERVEMDELSTKLSEYSSLEITVFSDDRSRLVAKELAEILRDKKISDVSIRVKDGSFFIWIPMLFWSGVVIIVVWLIIWKKKEKKKGRSDDESWR